MPETLALEWTVITLVAIFVLCLLISKLGKRKKDEPYEPDNYELEVWKAWQDYKKWKGNKKIRRNMKKDDFIFGPYDPHADEEEEVAIQLPQIYVDDEGREHKMPYGHHRCECCGNYFSADEGDWEGDNFFCKKDLRELRRDCE